MSQHPTGARADTPGNGWAEPHDQSLPRAAQLGDAGHQGTESTQSGVDDFAAAERDERISETALELDRLRQENDQLRAEMRRLEDALAAVLRSTSWRMTLPVRQLLSRNPNFARLTRRAAKAI